MQLGPSSFSEYTGLQRRPPSPAPGTRPLGVGTREEVGPRCESSRGPLMDATRCQGLQLLPTSTLSQHLNKGHRGWSPAFCNIKSSDLQIHRTPCWAAHSPHHHDMPVKETTRHHSTWKWKPRPMSDMPTPYAQPQPRQLERARSDQI